MVADPLLHLDQDDRFPDVVGACGPAAIFAGFANAELGRAARVQAAGLAVSLEQAVEEDLRFALFVAVEFVLRPLNEGIQAFSS